MKGRGEDLEGKVAIRGGLKATRGTRRGYKACVVKESLQGTVLYLGWILEPLPDLQGKHRQA
jgi:hypothetical protein